MPAEIPIVGETIRAVVQTRYGPPEALSVRRVATPAAEGDRVLIAVRAAGLNIADCFGVRGTPLVVRAFSGLLRPRNGVPGMDVAGVVVRVGPRVRRFLPGDEVFGTCWGACAEAAAAAEETLVAKPARLRWEQAAAVPTAALAALHAMQDAGKVRAGQRVLINGAAGGVGHFAVQLAKLYGAEVTAVCGPRNVEMLRALGADHVVDYTREDFTRSERRYDLILDNVENRPLAECRRALTVDGTLILNSGTGARGLAFAVRLLRPLALSPFVRHNLRRYFSAPNRADMETLRDLLDTGKLAPVVSRTYSLAETPAALLHIETGHASGKVVIETTGHRG
jgi:NADPH:quinone reductase-like Zn-dependent oxidoreductase